MNKVVATEFFAKTFYLVLLLQLVVGCSVKANKLGITINPELPTTAYDPVNVAKKTRILTYIADIGASSPDKLIIGQSVGHADWEGSYFYASYRHDIEDATGKLPAIIAIDIGWQDFSRDYSSMLADIEAHWNAGGLVTLSAHMPNPATLGDVRDKRFGADDYRDILHEGTITRARWLGMLSNIANLLQVLKAKRIIVLWRPLHEMNGGWFWWGNDQAPPSQEQFKNLWVDMYDYFYHHRRIDNVLWVYAPNYRYRPEQPEVAYYYPGDEYVDIVGLDYYNDTVENLNQNGSYDQLVALAKPVAICEIGTRAKDGSFDNNDYLNILRFQPAVSYIVVWHSWDTKRVAIHDVQNAWAFMNNESLVTLEKVDY